MEDFEFSDELDRVDFERVTAWLASSYWSPGIDRATVEQGARNSTVVIGAYSAQGQIAFGRVISDTTRFAYIADVFVDSAYRGQGIATALVKKLIAHPRLVRVNHWYLLTMDAQPLYRALGFEVYDRPDRTFMAWNRQH